MEKRLRRGLFRGFRFLPTCPFLGSVAHPVSVFEKGESARRSRTTERSESVSEEAEEHRKLHFLLTHLCGISHPAWRTFHTIRTVAT